MGANRIYKGWRVVIGAGVGIGFGSAVFFSSAFALFAVAIAHANGWSQTDVARGASLGLLLQALGYAAAGWFIDRSGSRKVAAASIALFALSLVALGMAGDAYWRYLGACGAIGLLAAGTNMVGYARAIAQWFDARRGLAMGIAAGFQALGSISLPIVTQKIIAGANWPTAAFAIAGFEAVVCLPLVLWLVVDAPGADVVTEAPRAVTGGASALARPGATFVQLAIAFAIMGFTFYAVITNVAFILAGAHRTSSEIARFQAVAGLSVLVGRIAFGRLLDYVSATVAGVLALVSAAAFVVALANAESAAFVLVAAALAGFAVGGESDLLPYLASRYWGRERMSRLLGLFLVAFVLGAALGPVAFAHTSAVFGGPQVALYALALLQIVPAALFLTLPAYPRS